MNREDIRAKAAEAKELVEDIEEPFKTIAFEVLFRKLLEQEGTPTALGPAVPTPDLTTMTIGEFLSSKNCGTLADQLTAIGYYFFHVREHPTTSTEFLQAFAKARLPRPKNVSDVVAKCIRKGFLADAPEKKDGKKAWQITSKGERYVEDQL